MTLSPAFVTGFLAAAFQIFLLREFSAHFYGNELTYGFVLASWLFWGGAGSILASRFKPAVKTLEQFYYLIILLFPLSLLSLRFSRFALGLYPGEMTGMASAVLFSLGLCFLTSFPLGGLFVLNASLLGGNIARVYVLESLGAAAAGIIVDLCLVPFVSNWQGAALLGAASATAVFLTFGRRKKTALFLAALTGLAAFAVFDIPSQKIIWKPLNLIRSQDTPYGKLQAFRTGDQWALYSSGLPVFFFPNPAAAEESVHFAMLQNPGTQNILLIGGGVGGGLDEILKYQPNQVDYVELDPGIIRIAQDVLPDIGKAALADPRIRIFFEDGRSFLSHSRKIYDAILLNLPEPSSAQINRFYTKEFFDLAKSRLSPAGVFSFLVPSSENYIGPELQQFLASLDRTLRGTFREVQIVAGETNVFLASSSDLTIDFEALKKRIETIRLKTTYVSPSLLASRLSPLRTAYLKEKIEEKPARINQDLFPVSYYFHSVLWSSQFRGFEARWLRFFSGLSSVELLGLPLLAYLVVLAALTLRRRSAPGRYLVPVWTMGFTTIVVELAAVIAFQTFHGYVYGKIALLLAAFMAGLFLGSWTGLRRKMAGRIDLIFAQGGMLLLLTLFRLSLNDRTAEILLFLCLLAFGALGGFLFIASNRLFLKDSAHTGLGYGLELMGSFLGAVLAAAFIIPLAGILSLLDFLLLMNLSAWLFILIPGKTA